MGNNGIYISLCAAGKNPLGLGKTAAQVSELYHVISKYVEIFVTVRPEDGWTKGTKRDAFLL